jgi:hypothetical protein
MAPSFAGYSELIKTFYYQEEGAFSIPKQVRERAFILAVDIEIISVAKENYVNYKSKPAHGFYGYAVLVFQDHSEIQIPITQPRQRLYYGRLPEAFANEYALYLNAVTLNALLSIANDLLVPIGAQLGLSISASPPFCPTPPPWIELPLREGYIKTSFGTTFALEFSYWVSNGNIYGECSYDGKSGQNDGEKDSGLPPSVQPQRPINPSSPYTGFPSPTPDNEKLGFQNSKGGLLDDPNPDNAQEEARWYVLINVNDFPFGCPAGMRNATFISPSTFTTEPVLVAQVITSYLSCNGLTGYSSRWTANGVQIGTGNHVGGALLTSVYRTSPPIDLAHDWR